MISAEQAFNELGIDAITATEMMDWLGISKIDLGDPSRFSKFQSVIEYFKQFPSDTQRFLIRRVTQNPNHDRLQRVWEYAELLKNKKSAEDAIEKIKTEASAVSDPVLQHNYVAREAEARQALTAVTQEMALYEK